MCRMFLPSVYSLIYMYSMVKSVFMSFVPNIIDTSSKFMLNWVRFKIGFSEDKNIFVFLQFTNKCSIVSCSSLQSVQRSVSLMPIVLSTCLRVKSYAEFESGTTVCYYLLLFWTGCCRNISIFLLLSCINHSISFYWFGCSHSF